MDPIWIFYKLLQNYADKFHIQQFMKIAYLSVFDKYIIFY